MRPARRRGTRARQFLAVLPYVPRIGRWSVLGGALLLSVGLLLWASALDSWGPGLALSSLRLAATGLCAAAVFALDDPAADITAASPLPLRHRRGASLALAVTLVAGMWVLLLGLPSLLLPQGADAGCLAWLRKPLTIELLWLLAVGTAVATVNARRLGGTAGGIAAAPAVMLLYAGAHQLPAEWALIAGSPLDSGWGPAHRRLLVLALVGLVVTVWAVRDPWHRTFGRGRLGPLRGVWVVIVVAATVALAAVPARALTATERLDAKLDDLVANQGIEQLTVLVASGDLRWSATVGDAAPVLPVGTLSLAEIKETVAVAAAPVDGATTIERLETWMRELTSREGPLGRRLAGSAPPAGTAWSDRDAGHAAAGPVSELRYVSASGTLIATMTGTSTAPCGSAVADALLATMEKSP